MHDRVAAFAFVVVAVQNAGRVGHGQDFGEVIYAPSERVGQFVERNEAEQIAQDADSMRDIVERSAPIEAIAGPGAGGEQAVGNGLGEQIGELRRRQRSDEVGLKCLEKAGELTGILPFLSELFADHIAEKARALGQFDSESLQR